MHSTNSQMTPEEPNLNVMDQVHETTNPKDSVKIIDRDISLTVT